MAEGILTLTDGSFDEQIASASTPVIVDFWADWCGPCKQVAPIIEELAVEQKGKLTFAKLDVDANPNVSMRFNVMSIPTMIVFKDGAEVKRIVGSKGKHQLLDDFKEFI